MQVSKQTIALGAALSLMSASALADFFKTDEEAQMNALNGWAINPVFTVGEEINGYTPPGILDGIGAFHSHGANVRVLVNHELNAENGYVYQLANGTQLTGARVSYFDMDRAQRSIRGAGLAYDSIYDRTGALVTSAVQINEGNGGASDGFDRLCSAYGFHAGTNGLMDDVFFTGEEVSEFGATPAEGLGGQEAVIDVRGGVAYVAPMLGRAAFENVSTVENFGSDKVAIIIGDDRQAAPLYLYIGQKGAKAYDGAPDFLARNGLAAGKLYVWVADNGDTTPEQFNGTGNSRSGQFVMIDHFDPAKANTPDYDSLGFASMALQDAAAGAVGAFRFSRPEDVAGNPKDGTQIVMASTGRGGLYPSDNWGTLYIIDIDDDAYSLALAGDLADIDYIPATFNILLDTDDTQFRDFAMRSADNLDWADDGMIYVNEDRSTVRRVPKDPAGCAAEPTPEEEQLCLDLAFGGRSTIEASMWAVDPSKPVQSTLDLTRIAVMNRAAQLPDAQTDGDPLDLGDWESSGVLDVTELFVTKPGERLLIGAVQAHSVTDGNIGGRFHLGQGGQLFFISAMQGRHPEHNDENDDDDRDY